MGGNLYLRGTAITALPDNLTVGGNLDLEGTAITALPDNLTVGGYLYLEGESRHIGAYVNTNFFWYNKEKTFAIIDGIFCEILSKKQKTINSQKATIYVAKKIAKKDTFFIVNIDKYYAHGESIEKSFSDLQFKIVAEKLKNEPINEDTVVTVQHYRLITGACEMGCKNWMESNGVKTESIKASELLPLLKKTNAYGYERFKQLITF